jgi:hypothetical protein
VSANRGAGCIFSTLAGEIEEGKITGACTAYLESNGKILTSHFKEEVYSELYET